MLRVKQSKKKTKKKNTIKLYIFIQSQGSTRKVRYKVNSTQDGWQICTSDSRRLKRVNTLPTQDESRTTVSFPKTVCQILLLFTYQFPVSLKISLFPILPSIGSREGPRPSQTQARWRRRYKRTEPKPRERKRAKKNKSPPTTKQRPSCLISRFF